MNRMLRLGAAVALALAVARPAGAQRAEPVRPGQTVTGTLSAGDPGFANGSRFRVYRLDARAGKVYLLALRSTAFDPRLMVTRDAGPVSETLHNDDDGGDGNNSLIRFAPRADGSYLAVVTVARNDSAGVGAFELEVHEELDLPAVPRPLALGDSVRGELGPRSAAHRETRARYDVYTFSARKGQRVRVTLTAVTGPSVETGLGVWAEGAYRPFPGERPPSRRPVRPEALMAGATTTFVVPDDGEYAAVAAAAPGVQPAPYTLRLMELPPVRTVPRRAPITAGVEVRDTLSEADPREEGKTYREWLYPAHAGGRITVTMRSAEIDSYLSVGFVQDGRFVEADYNDDWQERDARLSVSVPQAREYVIRAMSLLGETGVYTIRVDSRSAMNRALRTGRIQVGEEVPGTLDDADAELDLDGSPYEQWILRANAGERVVVTLRSNEFDTFLSMGRMEGGEFREYWSNDDARGEDETDRVSRVIAVLPAAGDYVIRVNTFGRDESGSYTLKVERRPLTGAAARPGAAP